MIEPQLAKQRLPHVLSALHQIVCEDAAPSFKQRIGYA